MTGWENHMKMSVQLWKCTIVCVHMSLNCVGNTTKSIYFVSLRARGEGWEGGGENWKGGIREKTENSSSTRETHASFSIDKFALPRQLQQSGRRRQRLLGVGDEVEKKRKAFHYIDYDLYCELQRKGKGKHHWREHVALKMCFVA